MPQAERCQRETCHELLCPRHQKTAGQRNGLWCRAVESKQLDAPHGMYGGAPPLERNNRRNMDASVSGKKMKYNGKKAKCQKKCSAKWNPSSVERQWPRSHWLQWDEDLTQGLRGAAQNYQDNSEQAEMERSAQGHSNLASSCQLRPFSNGHDKCHNLLVIMCFVSPVII